MRSVIRTVDVARPLSHVYDQWTRLEDFGSFMPAVVSVRQLDERTTAWVVMIAKEKREFAAVVTEQRPDNRIAWQGLGIPEHSGVVTFHRLAAGTTRVTVQLDWEPAGAFDTVGDRLGLVERAIDRSLRAFARHVEAQDVAPPGWRGTIEPSDDDVPAAMVVAAREPATAGRARPGRSPDGSARPFVPRDGRGRAAEGPTEVPPKGWLDVLKRAGKQVKADDIQMMAAAVAFYLFLSIIPALGASISLYGLVSDPAEVEEQLAELTTGLPEAASELIVGQAQEIASAESAALSVGLAVSIVLALYSASKGIQALVKALNVAYDEEETRGFLALKLLSLALTFGVILLVVGGVAALVAVGELAEGLPGGGTIVNALRWPGLGAILVVVLAMMYRFSPDRDDPKWRWTTPGAVLAAVLLAVASLGFSFYTANFGSEEASGLLGAVGVLLLWLFLCAFAILFGAEVDSELEHQTAKDTTTGPPEPMGQRDALVADTVAR
jgi:membrane protein